MVRVWDNVTPASPIEEQPTIGLIGMGAMGRMYANYFSKAGWKKCLFALLLRIHAPDSQQKDPCLRSAH